ncbi:putative mismatch repair protein MSH5 [Trypanosoma conorhini]|uniref:Putative mismatch repair protein MSH5 n=1 Tax=Trypanosoma conorhini TaxID=83891 RepID=A0A3R7P2P5_9TRYP|nr:putative mismatch repair protein MSH5 [Trypanosoma conorhini]RNF11808.1 putative mismatch repair protein MSH5 [Trypanosoma conorhini]
MNDASEAEEALTSQVIVSVLVLRSRVGFASYDSATCQVSCAESAVVPDRSEEVVIRSAMDVPGDIAWVAQLLALKRPKAVLIPSAGSQVLLDIAFLFGVNVVLTAPREFDEGRIWDLLSLLWGGVTRLEWNSRICPSNHVMLMALSALLPYLQRCECPIADVVEVPPMGLLYVDQDTLSALQLRRTEPHPMDYQGIGRGKEGLSLLSVVDRTCSVLGRALLRQWFALPVRDEEELRRRYDVVSFFTAQENYDLMVQLRRALRHVRYTSNIFTKIRAAKHTTTDYENLLRTVKGFLRISSLLSPVAHSIPLFLCIVTSCQNTQLEEMGRLIDGGISFSRDPGGALSKTYVHIRAGFDATLDELHAHCARLDEVLTNVAHEESRCLPSVWGRCSVVCLFAPHWGYVVTLPRLPLSVVQEDLPPDWELLLQTEEGPFFKTPLTRRMDEELGDVRSAILEREGAIQRQLDQQLIVLSPALIPLHLCAELDCLMGFALCALEGQWSRPEIVPEPGVLVIDRGFHPIFARTAAHQVVPYSLNIRHSTQRVCVVTGANGSGKSVFITAVAHAVFLAHIGSYVPCAHATIGLLDTLMALYTVSSNLNDRNSASAAKELQSSFGNELVSMSRMLQRCSSRNKEGGAGSGRSLLVLDEFGKGTLSMDGAALLAASILSLISFGERRPIVLLATHYVEVLQPRLIPREEIVLLEMQTTLARTASRRGEASEDTDEEVVGGAEQLVHTYSVGPVQSTGSMDTSQQKGMTAQALHFALQFSVPPLLLQRAWELIVTEGL